jgi:mannose-6-phosphate isomerase
VNAPAAPVELPPNQPAQRFYRGGEQIAAFRGHGPAEPYTPEDWVGSVTEVRGQRGVGLTVLDGGELLRDAIAADPVGWLGAEHVARWGSDPQLLVKLLDAGQRLPVHAHPDDAWAASHLGAAHGKAEAWYVLRGGTVHVGFRDELPLERLSELIAAQDTAALLGLLNAVEVAPHDSVLVPPGTAHAIGEGVLIAEVQQPEDLSILMEWHGFALDGAVDGHLGVGFDVALGAIDTRALTGDRLSRLVRRDIRSGSALPSAADAWFRLDRVRGGEVLPAGLAIVIGEDGELELATEGRTVTPLGRGSTVLVPSVAGALHFSGSGSAVVARPPDAGAPGR